MEEIRKILEFDTAGDPMTGRKWTRMTPEKIARCLEECIGLSISATTVHRILTRLQYSLKGNKKSLSCGFHPDRDQQFMIIQQLRVLPPVKSGPSCSIFRTHAEVAGFENQERAPKNFSNQG